jgi:hypothetical protein
MDGYEDYAEHLCVEAVFAIHHRQPLRFDAIHRLPAHLRPLPNQYVHVYCPLWQIAQPRFSTVSIAMFEKILYEADSMDDVY